jgi:hypothetical protein
MTDLNLGEEKPAAPVAIIDALRSTGLAEESWHFLSKARDLFSKRTYLAVQRPIGHPAAVVHAAARKPPGCTGAEAQ